ncbi:MAG: SLC13 family permease [Burkholderiales bacterium]
MTPEIALLLVIIAVAMIFFAFEWLPADLVALAVMLSLIATELLTPAEAFAGFGSNTLMMLLGLLILTAALNQTGVVELAGRAILDRVGGNQRLLLPAITGSAAFLSAFISNTAAAAFFIPIVIGFAAKIGSSPSRFLLPVAFATILTSSVTLISTSTNLVVSELMTSHELAPMGMFELAPVGIPIALAGLLYLLTIGVRLMPERGQQKQEVDIGDRAYQADVLVPAKSPLIGKTLAESKLGKNTGLRVINIVRGDESRIAARSDSVLKEGDVLVLEGSRDDVLKVKDLRGVELKADVHLAHPDVNPENLTVVEGVLLPGSPLIGRTLSHISFSERYGLQVLAINHRGRKIAERLSRARLSLGDVLLLQGTPENVRALEKGNLFNIFGGVDSKRLKTSRAPLAVVIFLLALAAATFNWLPLPVAVLGGALIAMATRCIAPEEAYRQVDWKVLILIGSLLALGAAMEKTGAGEFFAAQLIAVAGTDYPFVILSCFFFLTVALTQPMSNQAAAILLVPIAIQTALQLGLDPRPFAMMIAVAASTSYLTPLEPACLMVYGPGNYRFADFFKVGLPLTFLIYAIAILLVPKVWPL